MKFFLTGKAGAAKGQVWPVSGEVVLGREHTCDIALDDYTVSRRHCVFRVHDGKLLLEDLGSSNATLINGRPQRSKHLQRGDEIAVGNAILLVGCLEDGLPENPEEDPGASTARVRIGESGEVEEEPAVSGTPKTIEDLAEFFDALRALSRASTVEGLMTALLQRLEERFAPRGLWVVLRENGDAPFKVFPHSARGAMESRPLLRSKAEQVWREGITQRLHLAEKGESVCMLAPIALPQSPQGVIIIEGADAAAGYEDHDLELLLAIAQGVAPYIVVVQRLEQLELENERLISGGTPFTPIVGSHPAMRRVRALARNCAKSNLSVLLLGETGTGKELVARMIHDLSDRQHKPLVVVNCAAIPEDLFESELFGHELGAFTGAHARKNGLMETCAGGTLFLDEVGDLSLPNQARLLRAIEQKCFRRVGGNEDITAEFRLISATNKKLSQEIQHGAFRRDFYHRINGVEIPLPPLRERRSDIPALAEYFLNTCQPPHQHRATGFSADAMEALQQHPWPGNIRELRNVVERAAVLAPGPEITAGDLVFSEQLEPFDGPFPTLEQMERRHIREALQRCNGNVQEAAALLGMGRSTLYRKIEEFGLNTA